MVHLENENRVPHTLHPRLLILGFVDQTDTLLSTASECLVTLLAQCLSSTARNKRVANYLAEILNVRPKNTPCLLACVACLCIASALLVINMIFNVPCLLGRRISTYSPETAGRLPSIPSCGADIPLRLEEPARCRHPCMLLCTFRQDFGLHDRRKLGFQCVVVHKYISWC
jgi:hypothetical protein